MKKVSKLVMMLLLGAFTFGLTACSSDDNNESSKVEDPVKNYPTAAPTSMEEIAKVYVNSVVKPTYKELAAESNTLYNACSNLYSKATAGTMQQSDIDAACDAFKSARLLWEQSEAFLYGAAEDKEIDPHIDSWPLDHDELVSALTSSEMLAGIKGENPTQFIFEKNAEFQSVLGFHGMEFILFRDGANRTVAALQANDTDPQMTSVKGIDELAYLVAIAGDVRNMCYALEASWLGSEADATHTAWLKSNASYVVSELKNGLTSPKGNSYAEYLLATGTANGWNETWQATLSNIFIGGCSNISQEVYTQKLGQAYRVATGQGGTDDAGDYIESPYSKRSFKDYQDNIYSIKNSLYGTRDITATAPVQNSLLNYLKHNGYSETAELSAALNDALSALESAKNSGKAFIDAPGDAQVKNCIDKVQALDDALQAAGKWIAKQAK